MKHVAVFSAKQATDKSILTPMRMPKKYSKTMLITKRCITFYFDTWHLALAFGIDFGI
jgi:hypothetical protein